MKFTVKRASDLNHSPLEVEIGTLPDLLEFIKEEGAKGRWTNSAVISLPRPGELPTIVIYDDHLE